ncbi:hypothetical protein DIPPA_30073 [Diplonema papillatum]|nr:hypothetical protein DIPPA_30073 [Diplonema papillatum]
MAAQVQGFVNENPRSTAIALGVGAAAVALCCLQKSKGVPAKSVTLPPIVYGLSDPVELLERVDAKGRKVILGNSHVDAGVVAGLKVDSVNGMLVSTVNDVLVAWHRVPADQPTTLLLGTISINVEPRIPSAASPTDPVPPPVLQSSASADYSINKLKPPFDKIEVTVSPPDLESEPSPVQAAAPQKLEPEPSQPPASEPASAHDATEEDHPDGESDVATTADLQASARSLPEFNRTNSNSSGKPARGKPSKHASESSEPSTSPKGAMHPSKITKRVKKAVKRVPSTSK